MQPDILQSPVYIAGQNTTTTQHETLMPTCSGCSVPSMLREVRQGRVEDCRPNGPVTPSDASKQRVPAVPLAQALQADLRRLLRPADEGDWGAVSLPQMANPGNLVAKAGPSSASASDGRTGRFLLR